MPTIYSDDVKARRMAAVLDALQADGRPRLVIFNEAGMQMAEFALGTPPGRVFTEHRPEGRCAVLQLSLDQFPGRCGATTAGVPTSCEYRTADGDITVYDMGVALAERLTTGDYRVPAAENVGAAVWPGRVEVGEELILVAIPEITHGP
jgi:hypothetical protein